MMKGLSCLIHSNNCCYRTGSCKQQKPPESLKSVADHVGLRDPEICPYSSLPFVGVLCIPRMVRIYRTLVLIIRYHFVYSTQPHKQSIIVYSDTDYACTAKIVPTSRFAHTIPQSVLTPKIHQVSAKEAVVVYLCRSQITNRLIMLPLSPPT